PPTCAGPQWPTGGSTVRPRNNLVHQSIELIESPAGGPLDNRIAGPIAGPIGRLADTLQPDPNLFDLSVDCNLRLTYRPVQVVRTVPTGGVPGPA
ncbi:hypothetical protein, partial [Candidatus Frankia alpina]|uniref:hypothetical protein n=1 Tax=Candidatus Frankia alpina TaxID=2699483 RepID=UPI001A9958D8